jgi:hypothetical protein
MVARHLEQASLTALDGRPDGEALKSAARYFLNLDLSTNPQLFGREERRSGNYASARQFWSEITAFLISELWARLHIRIRNPGEPVPSPRRVAPEDVAYVSSMMLGLLDDSALRSAADRFQAYTAFGSGELYMRVKGAPGFRAAFSNGGPNGALIFLFPEFALLAIETGVDVARWQELLPALIAACGAFVRAYGQRDGKKMPRPIHSDDYPSAPVRELTDDERRALLEEATVFESGRGASTMHKILKSAFTNLSGVPPEMGHTPSPAPVP